MTNLATNSIGMHNASVYDAHGWRKLLALRKKILINQSFNATWKNYELTFTILLRGR